MLLRMPQKRWRKQGSTEETQWFTWHSSSKSSILCWKQSAIRPHDAGKAGKKRSLHSLWSVEGIPNVPCLPPYISNWCHLIFVYFIFDNLILSLFLRISDLNTWRNTNVEKTESQVNQSLFPGIEVESQMGFEPTTLRDLVGCNNHWATGESIVNKGQ